MAKEAVHNMPLTRGTFQVKGIVRGVKKDNFYSESKTQTGKAFRKVNFGVMYDNMKSVYITLTGMPKDKAYYTKKDANGKTKSFSVDWKDRTKGIPKDGRLIGVNCGLTKMVNAKNKMVNDNKMLVDFDACEYIAGNLVDDSSVFVRGNVDFSSFLDKEGNIRRNISYVPTQISLCQEVDFDEYNDEYGPTHEFMQTIVFMGIEKEREEEKLTGRYVVSAKIVTYSDIIDAEFIMINDQLASIFHKKLKPYTAISVHGNIEMAHKISVVSTEDSWGEPNKMKRQDNPTKIELIITGAEPETINKETYTEKQISEAIAKIRNANKAEQNFGEEETVDTLKWGDEAPKMESEEETPW